jgi:hypothetical protein
MSKNQFVETWRLVSAETKTASGKVILPLGGVGTGYLICSQDGHNDRRCYEGQPCLLRLRRYSRGNPEENVAAFGMYLSYCGTFEVKVEVKVDRVVRILN